MRISVPTNHNYYEEYPLSEEQLQSSFGIRAKKDLKALKSNLFTSVFEMTTHNASLIHLSILGFKSNYNLKDQDEEFILKLYAKESVNGVRKYFIQTGKFAGVIYHKGVQFNITSAYGDAFLKRMLNCVNDIYVDNQEDKAKESNEVNQFQQIIAYLFIQSLERASILGLPRKYSQVTQTSPKVRGSIDFNAYLKNHIPFKGLLTTNYRSQKYIPEIIDVLYVTCNRLKAKFGNQLQNKVSSIYQLLKENYSGKFPSVKKIQKAMNDSVLHNPMYSSFKSTLRYADIILKKKDLMSDDAKNQLETSGYLFDIADLFELYLERTFNRRLVDWHLLAQSELRVYDSQFYGRRMLPDFVLKHKHSNRCVVLDAKFKTMKLRKKDLDRSDFYQIHSYIQYYMPEVILGGLIYPLSKKQDPKISYADHIFDRSIHNIRFIVEGIYLEESFSMSQVIEEENLFLNRIEKVMEGAVIDAPQLA